jgi:hypothetical protein
MNADNKANAWSVNEALLQSYRSLSYTVQSILLAVGALILENKNPAVFAVIATISIIQLLLFARVICVRRIIVDFYKNSLYDKYDENGDHIDKTRSSKENFYLEDKEKRNEINNDKKLSNSRDFFRSTRAKLDFGVPLVFLIIWGALAFLVFEVNCFFLLSLLVLSVSAICLLIIHKFS